MNAMEIMKAWADCPNGFGVADDLRCAAMEAQEEGIARKDYLEAAVAFGYNKGSAANCWAFVARKEVLLGR